MNVEYAYEDRGDGTTTMTVTSEHGTFEYIVQNKPLELA